MLVGMAISGPRGLLDLGQLTSEQLSAERYKDIEMRFLSALASACPGYAKYSLQPNRTLERGREKVEVFCRKIDEGAYDVKYATQSDDAHKNHFARNWLGDGMTLSEGNGGAYRMFFRSRFCSRAFVVNMACRSYKAKYGKYPEALSDLVPEFLAELPRDPYDGEELRYNATDHFIWTRGEKLDFNGKVEFYDNGKPRYVVRRSYNWIHFLDERPH